MTKTNENADFEFDFIDEYDAEIAQEGRWFNATNRNGVHLGRFKCKLMDGDMPAVKTYMQRQGRQQSNEEKSEEESIDDTVRMFISCSLVDWEVKSKGGDLIPFDKKRAYQYFSSKTTRKALLQLLQAAQTTANYLPDEEEPEKN